MRGHLLTAICTLACVALPAAAQPAETVFWDDAAGDVIPWSNAPDRPRPDLIKVEAESIPGAVRFTLTFKEPLQKLFDYTDAEGNKYAGNVLEIFIDSDNNPATGGMPSWASEADRKLEGYDFRIEVSLGYVFKDLEYGGEGWATGDAVLNVNKVKIERPFAKFGTTKLQQGSYLADSSRKNPDSSGKEALTRTKIEAEKLVLEVPCDWLELKSGLTARICIKDYQESAVSGKTISGDRLLKLK